MRKRQVYVYRKGLGVIPIEDAPPLELETKRNDGIISDTMQATWHPATGVTTDSKSHFRRMTKASGCIEVGNDRAPARKISEVGDRKSIQRTIKEVIERNS